MLVFSSPWAFLLLCLCVVESKTITSTITSTVPSPSSTQVSSSYSSDADFRSAVLNSTNFYRKHHNASDLSWNDSLATYAARYAQKCLWEHSVCASALFPRFALLTIHLQHGPSGENLAEGYPNTTAAIEAWGNEGSKYDFDRPTGFSESTGHFTQLVWKATTSVGCGRMACDGRAGGDDGGDGDGAYGWLVVCEYWPPGNVDGEYKNQVQQEPRHRASNVLGNVSDESGGIISKGYPLSWRKYMCTLLLALAAGLRLG
ncbi:hypothetical protein MMC07_008394 [Pseudocyphellaria aurata]|nr:hypothetical protein [Pseudocyphellaria aurata]